MKNCGLFLILSLCFATKSFANFSFNEFKGDLFDSQAKSIGEALSFFPNSYLENYTLIKNSQSIQFLSQKKVYAVIIRLIIA